MTRHSHSVYSHKAQHVRTVDIKVMKTKSKEAELILTYLQGVEKYKTMILTK